MAALKRNNLDANTLVVFSSDNGPIVDDGYRDDAWEKLGDHKPAGPWRGSKYSRFEAGTRVPLITRWPGRVKPGVSDALVSQIDFMASFAALAGAKLPPGAGPDTRNNLPALLGDSKTGREELVEHSGTLALRKGNWKFIPANKGVTVLKETKAETGNAPQPQLYDLASDPLEKNNLAGEPAQAAQLAAFRKQTAEKWDLGAVRNAVVESQRRRQYLNAINREQNVAWDYQPMTDARHSYIRNTVPIFELESRSRFPMVKTRE
jgi:arylsulfatase A-like enzyme